MAQTIIITAAGRAALVNAANNGTDPVTIASMGVTQTAFVPTTATTVLPGELKRITALSGGAVADDIIHLTVRDDGNDAYGMRGYAFYLSDATLFAVYGQADVIVNKTPASMMLLALDIAFADVVAASIAFGDTNFMLPIATTTAYGQIKLSTLVAAQAGTDNATVLTPSTARQSILGWLLAQDGSGSGIDADMLDGQHAADFLQASLFTGAQILSRLQSVDGSGTGLDADLLDGQHATAFLQASLFTGAQILSRMTSVDGSGSGLDADLLDGQDGSWYSNIIARLGYTPLNATAYTAADVLAKMLGMDGSGSGLDADLLDGQDGSWYSNVIARLGYTPLNTTAYTAADVLAKALTVDGAGSGLDADLLDGQQGSFYTNIIARLGFTPLNSTAYTAADVFAKVLGLDGSGSGLDADTIDGAQLAELVKKTDFTQNLAAGGYQILPSGLCLQWVRGASGNTETSQFVNFPLTFSQVFDAFVTTSIPSAAGGADCWFQLVGLPALNRCTAMRGYSGNTGAVASTPVIFAIGTIG